MPTYQYHCDVCDTTIDVVRKIADREFNPFCAGDFVIDPVGGDAQIENGIGHEIEPMHVLVSKLGAVFVRGPRFASGR